MPEIIPIHHGMEKIELARAGDFPGPTQLVGELPIFDFKLFERFELADIELPRGAGKLVPLTKKSDFSRDFEAATSTAMANQIDILRKGEFQAPNFAALSGQTNICSRQKKRRLKSSRLFL
jgi:hypothetical protein